MVVASAACAAWGGTIGGDVGGDFGGDGGGEDPARVSLPLTILGASDAKKCRRRGSFLRDVAPDRCQNSETLKRHLSLQSRGIKVPMKSQKWVPPFSTSEHISWVTVVETYMGRWMTSSIVLMVLTTGNVCVPPVNPTHVDQQR